MTPSELITYINDNVTSNGNNEITADVLRPVLVAMVEQINTLVGDENDLPSGSVTVIEAINNTVSDGITIYEGVDNPNDTPPGSFELGDFYNQVNGSSVTIAFWQFNGTEWAEILSNYQQKTRLIRDVVSSATLTALGDDIVMYNGSDTGDVITLPDVTLYNGKIIRLVNISAININTTTFKDLRNIDETALLTRSVLTLISNGAQWRQINND